MIFILSKYLMKTPKELLMAARVATDNGETRVLGKNKS